jgi:uncharacterized protein (TIGR00251 family)
MFNIKEGYVTFKIKAQPNSSINKIAGIYEDAIKINIKAPAVDGEANKELIKFLSKTFKIAKSDIKLDGKTSKRKTISLPLNEKVEKFIKDFS